MNKGDLVTNEQITSKFGGNLQGGIRHSLTTNSVVLITGTRGSLSKDVWNGDTLRYAGTGRLGDQKMSGPNRVLAESGKSGISVYLFTAEAKNKYRYNGEARLLGKPVQEEQPDAAGHMRSVWIFPLRLVDFPVAPLPEGNFDLEPSPADQSSVDSVVSTADNERQLWAAILRAERRAMEKGPRYVARFARAIERNPRVARLVKKRDGFQCQVCGAKGFAKEHGDLYAEAHHKEQLSELGNDAPSNMFCVCPTCHRVLHYGSTESLAKRRALAVEHKI